MPDCCKPTKNKKYCTRKFDKKRFKLPRRFNKTKCKHPKGFTMRASCAPFKYCYKTSKRIPNRLSRGKKPKKTYNKKKKLIYII